MALGGKAAFAQLVGRVKVRPALEADLHAVKTCIDDAFTPYIERIGKPPAPMLLDLAAEIRAQHVWVAHDGEAVLGTIVLFGTEQGMYIDTVAARPAVHGAGVGKALLTFAEDEARRLGYRLVYLCTNSKMTENQVFYPRAGYVAYDRKHDAGYDRVFYQKTLDEVPMGGGA